MRECFDDRTTQKPIRGTLGKKACLVLVLILGAMGSLPLVILTPPFQVPDEVQHFYRAYELSEFRIRSEVQNGVAGASLPESLPRLVKSSVYTKDEIFYPATPAPLTKTLSQASIPLDGSKTQFVEFPGSAFYSPLPYLPQILGIAVGRAIGLGPLYLLYLGRLFNCLAALGLIGLAVKSIPAAEELVILVGLLPMSLFLFASLSPDAAVIACALLFSALSFSASTRGNWRTWELVTAAATAVVFCSVKPVYAPLLLAGVVPGVFQHDKAAKAIRSHAVLLVIALGVTAGWLLFVKSSMTTPLDGTHPSVQISLLLHHPLSFMHVLVNTLGIIRIIKFYAQTVGIFGWLTVPLQPWVVYLLPLVSMVIVWNFGSRGIVKRSISHGLWCFALAFASAFLIFVALYLMWGHAGQSHVIAVQGRYFLPILILAGIAVLRFTPDRKPSAPKWLSFVSIAGITIVQMAAMDTTIIRVFHVF